MSESNEKCRRDIRVMYKSIGNLHSACGLAPGGGRVGGRPGVGSIGRVVANREIIHLQLFVLYIGRAGPAWACLVLCPRQKESQVSKGGVLESEDIVEDVLARYFNSFARCACPRG